MATVLTAYIMLPRVATTNGNIHCRITTTTKNDQIVNWIDCEGEWNSYTDFRTRFILVKNIKVIETTFYNYQI